MELYHYLCQMNTPSIIVRLLLSIVCGGVIGIERGRHRQAAGFRTYILVCMGSALAMITNFLCIEQYAPGQDPTRIGAQVISGIGFLGVGTIIITGNKQIKGLTTAAGLWASACMGLTIGAGYFGPAIIAFILIFLVMTVLNYVDKQAYQSSKIMDLYIEFRDIKFVTNFLSVIRSGGMKSSNLELTKSKVPGESTVSILITINLNKRAEHERMISEFSEIDGINFIEEMQ